MSRRASVGCSCFSQSGFSAETRWLGASTISRARHLRDNAHHQSPIITFQHRCFPYLATDFSMTIHEIAVVENPGTSLIRLAWRCIAGHQANHKMARISSLSVSLYRRVNVCKYASTWLAIIARHQAERLYSAQAMSGIGNRPAATRTSPASLNNSGAPPYTEKAFSALTFGFGIIERRSAADDGRAAH